MSRPVILKNFARLVRDLLGYDEQLIKFDRENMPEGDFHTSYIVVNSSSVISRTSAGRRYDGDTEEMTHINSQSRQIILEFYGDDAYENADRFFLLSESQLAYDLKRNLDLTIGRVSTSTDVGQLLGKFYGNRVHLEMNVQFNTVTTIETRRIDTAQFEFLEDR
ncbi:tail-completion protein [Vibrio phage 1.052.A._10N.286.46.C3]|nr:tail-completion protein [Vibrio phage 1.052.A._10N.286.46.C3]